MPKVWTLAQRGISSPGPAWPRSSPLETEQPGAKSDRDRHLATSGEATRKPVEAAGVTHRRKGPAGVDPPPLPRVLGCNPSFRAGAEQARGLR